ncbi:MAG: hypothetical protein WCG13_00165 [Burkholderiales bacterium]
MIRRRFSLAAALVLTLWLAACGGGGGGSDAGTAPPATTSYATWQGWLNYLQEAGIFRYTITGNVQGTAVNSTGSASIGALQAASFESQPAQRKTSLVSGTLTVGGSTVPYGGTTELYVDAAFMPLGSTGAGEYAVVSGKPNIPTTAQVNESGTLFTLTRYDSSARTTLLGTTTVAWAVLPDSADTALFRITSTAANADGSPPSVTVETYRMSTAGALTRLTEEYRDSSAQLTLTWVP